MRLLPVWPLLLTLAIGTPLAAILRDREAAGHYAAAVAFYGGESAFFVPVPYAVAYGIWRFLAVRLGVTPVFIVALYGLASSLAWIAAGGDINAPTALILYPCIVGVVACTTQWMASIWMANAN